MPDRALILYRSFVPDLVLLDVMLPGLSGFDLGRVLRHGGKTPIIILSARGEKGDKLQGLRLGADDYMTKPFDMEELVARIHTVLRRVKPSIDTIRLGGVTIDFRRGLATDARGDLHLTHREFEILRVLAERHSRVVFREELFKEIWGFVDATTTRSVDRAVSRLRQKIESRPQKPAFSPDRARRWLHPVGGGDGVGVNKGVEMMRQTAALAVCSGAGAAAMIPAQSKAAAADRRHAQAGLLAHNS